ncbi:hypothetical protein AB1N83_011464 [Pleurotus pulmonarius]
MGFTAQRRHSGTRDPNKERQGPSYAHRHCGPFATYCSSSRAHLITHTAGLSSSESGGSSKRRGTRFLDGLKGWVVGMLHWNYETTRYFGDQRETVPSSRSPLAGYSWFAFPLYCQKGDGGEESTNLQAWPAQVVAGTLCPLWEPRTPGERYLPARGVHVNLKVEKI